MKSKLGFHVDIQGHQGQIEKMIQASTRVIKVISSMGMLRNLHDALGDTTIFIARDWNVGDDFLRFGGTDNPKEAARRWLDGMRPSIVQAPFAYWESFNEMADWSSMRMYGEFEAERQRLMAAEGFKACVGNFSTGSPPVSDAPNDGRDDFWAEFYPALEAAHQFRNILGLHEYGGLWMDLWYGPNQTEALFSGRRVPFPESREEGWLFGRYRRVWRRHIQPNGWTDIRIGLTEFGIDRAGDSVTEPLAGYRTSTWQTCGPAWQKLDNRNDPEQFYFEQLQWADRQMQKDPYILGATIFTWGTMSPVWGSFDIQGPVADRLVSYIQSTRDDEPSTSTSSVMPVSHTQIETVYVTPKFATGVVLRSGAGTQFDQIEPLYMGDQLELLDPRPEVINSIGLAGAWLKVRTPRGRNGWVEARLVQRAYVGPHRDEPRKPEEPLYLRTTSATGLFVRQGPGTQYKPITSIFPSDRLEVVGSHADARARLGQRGQWIQVRTPAGLVGFAGAFYLEILPPYYVWPEGHALAGLHGPADPGEWPWDEEAYRIIRISRVKALKILAAGDVGPKVLTRLRQEGAPFILARLFAKFQEPRTPQSFVNEVADAVLRLYDQGVRYFEVHNEPNLHTVDSPEGMWVAWQNGREFGQFFLDAVAILRNIAPRAHFGFPGASPGPDEDRVRMSSDVFLAQAEAAIRRAEFICMHTYWGADGTSYMDSIRKVRAFCDQYPAQLIFVSEFSNSHKQIGRDIKAREYVQFYAEAQKLPPNLGGLFSYLLSASSGYESERWKGSQIAESVGSRPTA